jgi:hypothetical protein
VAAIEDVLRECSDVFSDTLDHLQTSNAVGDEGADDKDKESIATDTSSYEEEPPDASAIYKFSTSEGTSKGRINDQAISHKAPLELRNSRPRRVLTGNIN